MLLGIGIALGGFLAAAFVWYVFFENMNANKARRDLEKFWRGVGSFFRQVRLSFSRLSKNQKILSVVILVLVVIAIAALVWFLQPQDEVWLPGHVTPSRDECGTLQVGVVGYNEEEGKMMTEADLKALGADVVIDSNVYIGNELGLVKPGRDPQRCTRFLPIVQSVPTE